MIRRTSLITAIAVLLSAVATAAPAAPLSYPLWVEDGFPAPGPPSVTAASWILYDELSDSVLASWDADTRRPPASITKIMTVLLAVENGDLDELVTVSEEAARTGGQEIGLVIGEQVTLGALVKAALIRSGNDAATAIAEHVGGSVEGFAVMMNQRASELGMDNSHFVNPHGLDANGHYSSARDMLIVGIEAMSHPEIADIARSRVMVFPDTPNGSDRAATNTNRILNSYNGAIGVKTGETPRAGLTYVGAAERNGRTLYAVVFRSVGRRAHFADAIELYDWGFESLGYRAALMGLPYDPIASRVAPSPLFADIAPAEHNGIQDEPTTVVPVTPEPSDPQISVSEPIEVTRSPASSPDGILGTLRYWLGLITGEFGG